MAIPGELHPQAGTHPASMSTGDYSIHPSGQPTSNPGTTTDKSGAAAGSPFALAAGLTGTASTGGTTEKRGNPHLAFVPAKKFRGLPQRASLQLLRLWRMDGLRGLGVRAGLLRLRRVAICMILRGVIVEDLLALELELRLGRALAL